ncbi:hypothetical protein DPMN_011821 [Dreissena polymorpha]|uniref:Uncharacterized protein n=1 Tax=Dreissena polymorpha TaxID=45954 RepID=A0A9D4N4P9_DREPO|nr:hypothetical protein DPMN_011744 [Dreissena polymorpha]KAH3887799.1 hypothetical protein DPMN_011821 [Dreissena polymorpha]
MSEEPILISEESQVLIETDVCPLATQDGHKEPDPDKWQIIVSGAGTWFRGAILNNKYGVVLWLTW